MILNRIGITVVLTTLFLISINLFWACKKAPTQKVVLTGFASGSLMDYYLIVNEDTTFQLYSNTSIRGNWLINNDTLSLIKDQEICAKIFNDQFMDFYCNEFKILELMTFKKIDPPRRVNFPQ